MAHSVHVNFFSHGIKLKTQSNTFTSFVKADRLVEGSTTAKHFTL